MRHSEHPQERSQQEPPVTVRTRTYRRPKIVTTTMATNTQEIGVDLTEAVAIYMLQSFQAKVKNMNSRVDFPDDWSRELLGDVDWMVHTLVRAFKNQSTVLHFIE